MTKSRGIMHEATAREVARVAALLKRDRKDARADRMRANAIIELENGGYQNRDAIPIPPTPEQLAKFEYRATKGENIPGTAHSIKTVRRVQNPRIMKLYMRGVLDSDTFPACKWYRDMFERSGLDVGCSTANLSERVAGEAHYGSMARSEAQAIARDYVRGARDRIGVAGTRILTLFDAVVLDEQSLDDASRLAKVRKSSAVAAFKVAAWQLYGFAAPYLAEEAEARK